MRVQILPLPPITHGDATHTPFVTFFDHLQVEDKTAEVADYLQMTAASWGSQGAFIAIGQDEFELSPHLELPDELREQLLAHLTAATTQEPQ